MTIHLRRLLALLLAVAIVLTAVDTSPAQLPPPPELKSKISLRYRRARSGSPLPIIWKIEWLDPVVGTGALEYEVYDEVDRLGEFRIPDFVLSPGKNEFNLLLPAFFVNSSSSLLTIHSRFVTPKKTFEFAEQAIRVPSRYVQWFSIGRVVGARATPNEVETKFFDKIRLETFVDPDEPLEQATTAGFELPTADLPRDPLTLCNFDVLVVTPAALSELREDQSGALRKWVRAGGSLCVITGGGLEPRHADLLNDLTSEVPSREKFVIAPKGFLLPDEDAPGTIVTGFKGLGRVAILRGRLLRNLDPDGGSWTETARFLLKGRNSRGIGAPDTDPTNLGRASGPNARRAAVIAPPRFSRAYGSNSMYPNLNAAPLGRLNELFDLLMPLGVTAIPLRVIVLILIAYVLTIGPVDYVVLGLLRLRRFTWLLFPVVTVGFAAYTLWLSQRYLGSNDSRRAVEIYDFVQGGTTARRTRIEMLFLGQENTVTTQVDNGLFAPVGRGNVVSRSPTPADMGNLTPETIGVDDRFPVRYRVVQQIPQWRPVLNRFFWIDPKPGDVYQPAGLAGAGGFDWNDAKDVNGGLAPTFLAQRVRGAFGPKSCAVLLRGKSIVYVLNDFGEFEHWGVNPRGRDGNTLLGTVCELCQRTPEQLFVRTANLSPNGGPELDDISLADSSDDRQIVLVIGVETESTLYLYRRLYSGSH
jgi:hypothetical protein